MTAALDITKEQRKTLLELLRQFIPGVLVWAYGSRVKWTARPNSDLDIVVFTTPAQKPVVSELKDTLAESDLPFLVDIHIWDEIPERFHAIIRNEFVVLQAAEENQPREVSGWQKIRLGSACEKIGSGATPRGGSEVYQTSGISLIRSQNIYNDGFKRDGLAFIGDTHAEELENVTVQPRDVLLNITGDSVARVCQVPDEILPARVNQHVAIIRPKAEILDSRFLHYFLIHPQTQAQMLGLAAAGATRNALTKGMIESFEVKAPSVSEQHAIASVLGALDDKIEVNRRINATLEAMAQAVFKFRFLDVAEKKLPKDWEVKPLAEITDLITKGTTPTQMDVANAPNSDIQVNFLRVNAIAEDGVILDDKLTKIPTSVHSGVLKRSILKAGDVAYTIAGTIGRMTVIREDLLPANCNQAIAIIRPKPGVPSGFILLSMKQPTFQRELHSNIVHAVQANLSLGMLSKAKIIFPPKNEFAQLFQPINDLLKRIDANRAESRTLTELRDALLPKLLSGELRVKEAYA